MSGPAIRLYTAVIVIYGFSLILARHFGVVFVDGVLPLFWQYLDPPLLQNDLLRSVYYLHSQPPLFNLFLGCVLKVFPFDSRTAFLWLFQAMALSVLLLLTYLQRKLKVPAWITLTLVALFAIFPTFQVYSNLLFYTLPAALLLLLSALFLMRFTEKGSAVYCHLFWWTVATVMLTRSLYHSLWFIGSLIVIALLVDRNKRKQVLIGALVPLLLVHAVYAKNYFLAGSFGPSSWLGMNLARGWVPLPEISRLGTFLTGSEAEELAYKGRISRVWLRGPFQSPESYRDLGYFQPTGLHPALDAPYKSQGSPNLNHIDYARISKEMLQSDLALIQTFPMRYLERVRLSLWLYLQPGPGASWIYTRYYDFQPVIRWRNRLAAFLFLGTPLDAHQGPKGWNLLIVLVPLLIAYGFAESFRQRRLQSVSSAVFIYISLTILIVTVTANCIEIGENDRIRWETDPLLLLLLGPALARIATWLREARYRRFGRQF